MSSTSALSTPASQQDGSYPRPQLMRPLWRDLSGPWGFRYDDANNGRAERWFDHPRFEQTIIVPFPPEAPASGIGDTGFHPTVWYQRSISTDEISAAGFGEQGDVLTLNFGAVDYHAMVWLNGHFLGEHVGGHTPFSFDVTHALLPSSTQSLVVRAFDNPLDVTQPRGKQDWEESPHVIWYHRTTGIWQPVWLEAVPSVGIQRLDWQPDLTTATVRLKATLTETPLHGTQLNVELAHEGQLLGRISIDADSSHVEAVIPLPRQRNGQNYETLLWSPEAPHLLDATVSINRPGEAVTDLVNSYLGLRSVAAQDQSFLLNDRPYFVRSVLSQGYWPDSHLAAPTPGALRREVELIKELGFNAARIHQKIEDPRFLFWADKLGLLVWEEMPSVFEFSSTSSRRLMAEWSEAISRDISHPCIVTWVPLNESWGVQHIAHSRQEQHLAQSLVHLTKTLDESRPVVSNDGWEHMNSDIITIHDYEASGAVLHDRYRDRAAVQELLTGIGPAGRAMLLGPEMTSDAPVMVTEFGGVKFHIDSPGEHSWGYSTAITENDFTAQLSAIIDPIRDSVALAGFCYTQLTDTLQEANGLLTESREPKIPFDHIRRIVTGTDN